MAIDLNLFAGDCTLLSGGSGVVGPAARPFLWQAIDDIELQTAFDDHLRFDRLRGIAVVGHVDEDIVPTGLEIRLAGVIDRECL